MAFQFKDDMGICDRVDERRSKPYIAHSSNRLKPMSVIADSISSVNLVIDTDISVLGPLIFYGRRSKYKALSSGKRAQVIVGIFKDYLEA